MKHLHFTSLFSIVLILFVSLFIVSCGRGESYSEKHEGIDVVCGEELELKLTQIPEGLSADDYNWETVSQGGDITAVLTDKGKGHYLADQVGYAEVRAIAQVKKDVYTEIFCVNVYPKDGIHFIKDHYYCIGGTEKVVEWTYDGYGGPGVGTFHGGEIEFTTEPDMGDSIDYMSSGDPGLTQRIRIVNVKGDKPTDFVLKMKCGICTAETKMTIYHRNDPAQIAAYLVNSSDYPMVEKKTVELGKPDYNYDAAFDDQIVSRMGKNPKGKYAICMTEKNVDGETYFRPSLMAKLPPEYLSDNIEEVEYIIGYQSGEPIHITDYYEEGSGRKVPAKQLTKDIVLINAATGKTEKTFCTLYGGKTFDSQTEYFKNAKVIYGDAVPSEEIDKAILNEVIKLWKKKGYKVKK